MADLTLRVAAVAAPTGSTYTTKAAPLLYAEADNNLINLDTEIHQLDTRLTLVEANLTALEGRVTTAEANIIAIDGRVVVLEQKQTAIGAVAPTPATPGQIWFNSSTGVSYIWDGAAWQPLGGATSTVSAIAPASPNVGDVWYDLNTQALNVWDGTAWLNASGVTIIDGLDDVISAGALNSQLLVWDPTATDGTNVGQWVATYTLDGSPTGGATDDF